VSKSSFSFILDFIFYCFLIFFISFIWLRVYIHDNTLIIVLSSIITLVLSTILSIIYKNKVDKYKLSKKEMKEKKEILNKLIFSNNLEINDYLLKFFNDYKITKHREFLEIKKDDEKILVFNSFTINSCDNDFILSCIKKSGKLKIKKIMIFASSFNKDCPSFIKNIKEFKIKLIDFDEFYINFIKKENIIPENKIIYEEKTRYSFKELLNIAFNRKKTKTYVVTGIIFLISSIFLRYNIYYIVFTTIMFLFALFSYFNKPFNKKISDGF